jgi:flagellar biosynthesis protein FlhF
MAIKRYKAKSIQEAIGRIKEDIGPDAMILSTRRIPKTGYGKQMFEVTAALQSVSADEDVVEFGHKESGSINRFNSYHKAANATPPDKWADHSAELFSIKDMLFLVDQAGGLPDFLQLYPESLNLYVRLVKAGISERYARQIMIKGIEAGRKKNLSMEEITKGVVSAIMSMVKVFDPFSLKNGGRHMAAFIGPTGVGKTTTIAKLAAMLRLNHRKEIGIISVDSYRIGAVDQLRTYASIMGLPCLSAFTPRELKMAVQKMRDKEIILIDTAGQSHLDKDRMKELGRFMEGAHEISSHLVLSATTERNDMKEAAKNFSILQPETYLFTKLDETSRRGAIIDQVAQLKMPISFMTNGQRVPEDILIATRKNILKFILRK